MATPADLLGQLAQQFEAAGQPQVAQQFRSMAGGGAPTAAAVRAGVSVPSPLAGQLGRTVVQPGTGAGRPNLLSGHYGSAANVPGPGSAQVAGRGVTGAVPNPALKSRPMLQVPKLAQQVGGVVKDPAMSGLGDAFSKFANQIAAKVPSRTAAAGGAGAGRPRIPTGAGFSTGKGPFEMGPVGSTGPGRPMGNPQTVRAAASALKVDPTSAKPGPTSVKPTSGGPVPHTAYAESRLGLQNWAKTFRNPKKIYEYAQATAKSSGGRLASTATGSRAVGLLRAANPAMAVAIVGNLMGVPRMYEEGTTGDQIAEGVLIGASFGASFGGVGALVGAPVGMALNIMTDGKAANFIQSLPVLGGFFGGTEEEKANTTQMAADMFATAAKVQGVENPDEVAAAASAQFDVFNSMMESGILDPDQAFQMILTAGRMAGLTGFPWNPDELTPIYSAEDISAITRTVSEEMKPIHDVATGLMAQDFSHIADEDTRARLITAAQRAAGDLEESFGSALRAPAQSAILAGAQRGQTSQSLGGQLGGLDEFEALLSGVG